ncbi:MAG: DUF4097 family beta strand repeat-containing protein, partial [Planctomycetota bacterium]
LKEGENKVFVVVDPDNAVEESDETNNKASTVVGGSGPKEVGDLDIAVEKFKIAFRDKYNAYYVVASIRNKGRDASPQCPVYFYVGDPAAVEPITHAAGPIKPGGVWNERSGNFGLREGASVISVAVDPDNAFAESDETNNRASLSVLIEDGRIVKQSVSYSSDEAKERRPSPKDTEAVSPICPPAHQRHFVRLVVGPDKMTFEGQQVTWEDLPKLLEKVPQRSNTVFTLALASNDMTLAQKNEATGRAGALAKEFGFDHLSYIGVHPLGSKAMPEAEPGKKVERLTRKVISSTGKEHKSMDEFIVPLASGSQLELDNINGAINVSGRDSQECTVKAAIKARTASERQSASLMEQIKVKLTKVGNKLLARVEQPKLQQNENVVVDFDITVPRNSNLDLYTKNGEIEVADISGQIECDTNNGEIKVTRVSGQIECKTKNGAITAKKTSGSTRLHSDNGEVNISDADLKPGVVKMRNGAFTCARVAGDLQLEHYNGEITITKARFLKPAVLTHYNGSITCTEISGDLQVEVYNGGVEISYDKTAPSVCNVSIINTHNGAIDFTGPANFSAVVEAETDMGGINTGLPLKVTTKGLMGKRASGTLGSGEGKLHIRAAHGAIRIK